MQTAGFLRLVLHYMSEQGLCGTKERAYHAEKLIVNLDLNPSSTREREGPHVHGNI